MKKKILISLAKLVCLVMKKETGFNMESKLVFPSKYTNKIYRFVKMPLFAVLCLNKTFICPKDNN